MDIDTDCPRQEECRSRTKGKVLNMENRQMRFSKLAQDHVRIEDGAMIGSQSGVAKSLSRGDVVSGTPAMPHRLWLKTRGLITRLPDFAKRLRHLEKKMEELEKRNK